MDKVAFARTCLAQFNRELTDDLLKQMRTLQRALIESEAKDVLASPNFASIIKQAFAWYKGSEPFTTWRAVIAAVLLDMNVPALILRFQGRRMEEVEYGQSSGKRRGERCMNRINRRAAGQFRRERRALAVA